jgi:PAS domain S-box-containing protein
MPVKTLEHIACLAAAALRVSVAEVEGVLCTLDPGALFDAMVERKLYRDTFEGAAVGIIHTSPTGEWLHCNRAVGEMLGYTPEELTGKSYLDVTHPEDLESSAAVFAQLLDGKIKLNRREKRILKKDGDYLWVSLSVATRRDPGGSTDLLIAVMEDISARKEAEFALIRARDSLTSEVQSQTRHLQATNEDLQRQVRQARQSEEEQRKATHRLHCIANAIPATICYYDHEMRCEFANEAFKTWFGTAGASPVGMTMPELQGAAMFRMNEPHVRDALAGRPQHFERRLHRVDGTPAVVDVQYRPDIDQDGRVRGFFVLVSDITVIEAAREAALKLAAAKTDFLANMSHEIRTPLNGVLGMTQLLLDGPMSFEQREIATTALNCGEHLLAIVNDVLDFSKIEAGSLALESIPFDLQDLVTQIGAAMAPAARQKGIDCMMVAQLRAPRRRGDPTRIRQILLNLLGNAVKFTSEGSVRLDVHSRDTDDAVRFEVTDTGIGMSTAQLPLVFERFTQADSSTSRRFGGSGLGLAICRRLVELMGGTLQASSELGRGSRFWFTVDLAISPPSERDAVCDQSDPTGTGDLAGLRVLVAEDNPVNQLLVERMLRRLGCQITLVPHGGRAIETWQSQTFDVILMDCQMPEMDGFEATRRIRSASRGDASIPIIALTAGALASDRAQALLAGMSDFLTKPVTAKTLETALRRLTRAAS